MRIIELEERNEELEKKIFKLKQDQGNSNIGGERFPKKSKDE